jgi:hypothetical protein
MPEGADDDVHLVDDGEYPNAEASRCVVKALPSMLTCPIVPTVSFVVANEATIFLFRVGLEQRVVRA